MGKPIVPDVLICSNSLSSGGLPLGRDGAVSLTGIGRVGRVCETAGMGGKLEGGCVMVEGCNVGNVPVGIVPVGDMAMTGIS